MIRRATNLFDNKTLAIHPASTIFGPFTDKQRQDMDVLDTTIRFSIGLEDVDDLFDDVRHGNAGTEVVSDILILQKRDRIVDIEPDCR